MKAKMDPTRWDVERDAGEYRVMARDEMVNCSPATLVEVRHRTGDAFVQFAVDAEPLDAATVKLYVEAAAHSLSQYLTYERNTRSEGLHALFTRAMSKAKLEPFVQERIDAAVEYGKALAWLTPVFEDVLGRKAAG